MIKNIFNKFFKKKHFNPHKVLEMNVVHDKPKVTQYFNTGLPPLEQNTEEIYDKFYSDKNALSDYYVENRLKFYSSVVQFIKSKNIDLNNKKILDVGCGNGHLLDEVRRSITDCSLYGCDFSSFGIDYAKTLFSGIHFFKHNVYERLDQSFDIIICTEVLEHLEYPERAIENMLQSINSNGYVILTVPDGRQDNIEEHINFWSPESWFYFIKREAQNNDFQVSTIGGRHNFAFILKK